jgi:hypothetical protein
VNTYACITETANSNPIKPIKIVKGIKVNNITINPPLNIWNKKVDKILSNVCPATILANNRTPKEKARAIYDTNSINTNKGTRARGQPDGTKYEKNFILC